MQSSATELATDTLLYSLDESVAKAPPRKAVASFFLLFAVASLQRAVNRLL